MNSKQRCPLMGIVSIIIILIISCMYVHATNECKALKEQKEELYININVQENTIQTLKEENNNLHTCISKIQDEKNELQKKLEEKNKPTVTITTKPNKKDFKSFMPYTAITNKNSKQWKMQKSATTDENGIRCTEGRPMVAVGTGWGVNVGDVVLIICENGNSFEAVIGDIKDDSDTMSDNKTTASNNCRCEFIVDMDNLNSTIRLSGNVAALEQYNGYVVNVQKIG